MQLPKCAFSSVARRAFLLTVLLVFQISHATEAPGEDVAGSHDSPWISRFENSHIVGYQALDYGRLQLPLGPYSQGKLTAVETAEGRITRIAYVAPPGKGALEIFRNFQQALSAAGAVLRFECNGGDGEKSCGDAYDFANAVTTPLLDDMRARNVMVNTLNAVNGDVHALTVRLQRPSGIVDISLLVSKSDDQPAGILLQLCEHQAMATAQVKVDAKAMSDGLVQSGHIALYDIHFATDSAQLEPTSKATLVEMASLLKAQPNLKVFIVGHTDNTGSLAHNLNLSQLRAESVVKALINDYHIDARRVAAKGLASYAPMASNQDERGRAKNRRVELVQQ